MHALHNYSFEENILGMRAPQNTKYIKGSLQERVLQLQFCINPARSQHFLLSVGLIIMATKKSGKQTSNVEYQLAWHQHPSYNPAVDRNSLRDRPKTTWLEMPPPCDTSSSPAFITPYLVFITPSSSIIWTCRRSVHTSDHRQESYPYTDYIQVCLRLRGKSCDGCLGCKPIPVGLSPFSHPVPELLQWGCLLQHWPTARWTSLALGSTTSRLNPGPPPPLLSS